MPLMDFDDATDVSAPPSLFLATPEEICTERGMRASDSQNERLAQFRSLAQETPPCHPTQNLPSANVMLPKYQGGSPLTPAFSTRTPLSSIQSFRGNNVDDADMSDDEVAIASGRSSRYNQGPAVTKFKLRPRPLRKEDAWDPDFLFRSY